MPSTNSERIWLPKHKYGPFFLKALSDFCMHHRISQKLAFPNETMLPHDFLSYILDIMARSMGEDKRLALIYELEEYKKGLPFDLR